MTRNLVPRRYRGVSVATVDDLSPDALRSHFVGKEAYRRTEFIVARRAGDAAVLRVVKGSDDPLFSTIVDLEVLADSGETAFVRAPDVDTGVPSSLARVALHRAPGARCVVVEGLYKHISFILEPSPIVIRVVEVLPPEPPKLVDQVRRVLETAEDLPPIEVRAEVVDLIELASSRPVDRYLFPCRGSGAAPAGAEVEFLDERPPRSDWVLVGCRRSREIHEWFYGDLPPCVEMCPHELALDAPVATLTKCCMLESGLWEHGTRVTVPWGSSLSEVREGLEALAKAVEPSWSLA